MKNAFTILGATPQDDRNKLQELFEDKQLLSDNDELINTVYSELTNLKKRINHEIKFFSKEIFEDFDKNFLDNDDEEQEMTMEDICSSIIGVGKWFDKKPDELFTTINENRKTAEFSVIGNIEVIENAVLKLKEDCISAVKKYFDFWEQKDIVSLFNMLVEQDDYMSFFIDDLLLHYENLLQEAFENKEKICKEKFKLIEGNANSYIDDGTIDDSFQNNITAFKKAINAWDKLAQPLQVNYEKRGAQHPASLDFVHDLRNKVIDMCNKSQEELQKLIKNLQYDYSARQDLISKISNSEEYINNLIKVLDVLISTFKEIDIIEERLNKDKKDFSALRKTLSEINNQIDPYGIYKKQTTSSQPTSNSSPKPMTTDDKWELAVKWIIGIIIVAAIIATISCFSGGMTAGGVISLIIGIITIAVANKWGDGSIAFPVVRVTSFILAGAMAITCIVCISSSQPTEGKLTTSNFTRCFDTSFTSSTSSYFGGTLYYEISPKVDSYSDNSSSSSVITVVVRYSFTGGSGHYQDVTIKLYKSNNYTVDSSAKLNGSFTYTDKSTKIISVDGYVYK